MALTQISTAGVKDDAVTAGKIPANAVGSSELADNAVDTAAIADNAVNMNKLSDLDNGRIIARVSSGAGNPEAATAAQIRNVLNVADGANQTTINSNANNRVITGSGTANTLEGEANLTFDGSGQLSIAHTDPKIALIDTTNNTDTYIFSDDNGSLRIQADQNSEAADTRVRIQTDGTERVSIDSNLKILDGDLVIGTSGHGIDFSATGNASGMSSEVLDGYEEGSWTPAWGTYAGSNADGVFTYYTNGQQGSYIKVGRTVTCWFYINYVGISTLPTGSYARLKGLPFTVASLASAQDAAAEGGSLIINWQNLKGSGEANANLVGFSHRDHNHVLLGHQTQNSINAASPGEIFGNSTFSGTSQYYLYGQISYMTAN
nr:hypothetical protein [uncultured Mediterranean phage uvMED]